MKHLLARALRSRYTKVLAIPAALFVCGWGYLGILQLTGNFHEIVPGEFYRSAQMDEQDITQVAKDYHIASIINLRGENKGKTWYDQEIQASQRNHIAHYDFRMSAKHGLDVEGANTLVELMRTAPKPLLIHCQAGADRSGLASALYLATKEHPALHVAEHQLSPVYGHISLPIIGRPQMDMTFDRMESLLKARQQWAMGQSSNIADF